MRRQKALPGWAFQPFSFRASFMVRGLLDPDLASLALPGPCSLSLRSGRRAGSPVAHPGSPEGRCPGRARFSRAAFAGVQDDAHRHRSDRARAEADPTQSKRRSSTAEHAKHAEKDPLIPGVPESPRQSRPDDFRPWSGARSSEPGSLCGLCELGGEISGLIPFPPFGRRRSP